MSAEYKTVVMLLAVAVAAVDCGVDVDTNRATKVSPQKYLRATLDPMEYGLVEDGAAVKNMTLTDFFGLVREKEPRITQEDAQRFEDILKQNWITSTVELATVTGAEFSDMGIPLVAVRAIKAALESLGCDLHCQHGGVPNDECSVCEGCLGAWTGKECETWNSSADVTGLVGDMRKYGDDMMAAVEEEEKLSPLPGRVGVGVDITTGRMRLPVIALSYPDTAKTWTNKAGTTFRLPSEARFEPITTGFVAPEHAATIFSTMGKYMNELYQFGAKARGAGGFYADQDEDVQKVFDAFFSEDKALSVVQQFYPIHKLSLPKESTSHTLHPLCARAVQALPPVYDDTTKPVFEEFIRLWGSTYTTVTTNGGMLEQIAQFDREITRLGTFSEEAVADQAYTEFRRAIHDGEVPDNDPAYVAHRTLVKELSCVGGSPDGCGGEGDIVKQWTETIDNSPVPLTYSLADISELIDDDTTRSNVQRAIHGYIQDQIDRWANTNTCPTAGCMHGTCTPPAEVCTCADPTRVTGYRCDQCMPGWSDPQNQCATPVCSKGCGGHGTCTAPETCTCTAPFGGPTCEQCISPGGDGTQCCPRCMASGKVGRYRCMGCDGTGHIPADHAGCFRCQASGTVPPQCTSTYDFPNNCYKCSACDGKAHLTPEKHRCPACSGTGTSPPGCTSGYDFHGGCYKCSTCDGNGWVV